MVDLIIVVFAIGAVVAVTYNQIKKAKKGESSCGSECGKCSSECKR